MKANILALIVFACVACKTKERVEKEGINDSIQTVVDTSAAKPTTAQIVWFNRIDDTRGKLSAIDIGKMSPWIKDSSGVFSSYTPPFPMGDKKLNNIAFHLEGYDSTYVNSLSIVLHIGDQKEKEQALSKFRDAAAKAFETLDIQMPSMFPNAILNEKEIIVDGKEFGTALKLDKSKGETWTIRITTRTTP